MPQRLANKGNLLNNITTKATLRSKSKDTVSSITCKSMANLCVGEHHHRR